MSGKVRYCRTPMHPPFSPKSGMCIKLCIFICVQISCARVHAHAHAYAHAHAHAHAHLHAYAHAYAQTHSHTHVPIHRSQMDGRCTQQRQPKFVTSNMSVPSATNSNPSSPPAAALLPSAVASIYVFPLHHMPTTHSNTPCCCSAAMSDTCDQMPSVLQCVAVCCNVLRCVAVMSDTCDQMRCCVDIDIFM